MAAYSGLSSVGLIERDQHGDVLWTWAYPSVSEKERTFFIRKSALAKINQEHDGAKDEEKIDKDTYFQFVYGQFNGKWYYLYPRFAKQKALVSKQIVSFSIVLTATEFNPERYSSLAADLAQRLDSTGDPSAMLECYLAAYTGRPHRGKGDLTNGIDHREKLSEDPTQNSMLPIQDLINQFQIECILILTALLLKKRIALYHPKLRHLLETVRSLPTLVSHRSNWQILHPYVELEEDELELLQKSTSYVAGFTNAAVETRVDLYDLFVNLSTSEITIAPNAKETFAMGKLHKDLARAMISVAADDANDSAKVVQKVNNKVQELLSNLRSLAVTDDSGRSVISLSTLRERKMPAATENFLFNLATAEGLVPM